CGRATRTAGGPRAPSRATASDARRPHARPPRRRRPVPRALGGARRAPRLLPLVPRARRLVTVPGSPRGTLHGARTAPPRGPGLGRRRDARRRPRPRPRLRRAPRPSRHRCRPPGRPLLRRDGRRGAGRHAPRARDEARPDLAPRALARRRPVGGPAHPAPRGPAGRAVPRPGVGGGAPVGHAARGRQRERRGADRVRAAARRDGEVRVADPGPRAPEAAPPDFGADARPVGRRRPREPRRLRRGMAAPGQGRGALPGARRPHGLARGARCRRGGGRGVSRDMSLLRGSAFVTGGGSGIGRAIAEALAAQGAPGAVLDLLPDGGKETVGAIEAPGGRVVNTGSVAGVVGSGGAPAYVASKHGVVGLTRQLAVSYAARGVTVNAICPGAVATSLRANSTRILGKDAPEMRGIGGDDAAVRAITPAGRRGTLEEVAAAACYLAGEEAAYVTGQTLVIDGGWTAR